MRVSRRECIWQIGTGLLWTRVSGSAGLLEVEQLCAQEHVKAPSIEEWMNEWMIARAEVGTLHLSRFAEPIYYLLKPITWRPNPGQQKFASVSVPVGFVTDFASIPQPFWSLLRPDGNYTYPAIVHDFLYWTQSRSRDEADSIFKLGMEDFGVSASTILIIYEALRVAGRLAWNSNARLKSQGEKRILKRVPDDPRATWKDWKKLPDVF